MRSPNSLSRAASLARHSSSWRWSSAIVRGDRPLPCRASRSCAGSGERSDIVRDLNVRHVSPSDWRAANSRERGYALALRSASGCAQSRHRRLFMANSAIADGRMTFAPSGAPLRHHPHGRVVLRTSAGMRSTAWRARPAIRGLRTRERGNLCPSTGRCIAKTSAVSGVPTSGSE